MKVQGGLEVFKISDFGISRHIDEPNNYVPTWNMFNRPAELMDGDSPRYPVDWYGLGFILHVFAYETDPFKHDSRLKESIMAGYSPKRSTSSGDLTSLINSLLKRDPISRLGGSENPNGYRLVGAEEIKGHPWFKCIDWSTMGALVASDVKSMCSKTVRDRSCCKY